MLQELGGILLKGEIYIGLGRGQSLHIFPDGTTKTEGHIELPAEAYFMLPLVTRLVPQEFLGTGDFPKIVELEETLGSITGRVEDVYKKVGPILASKGIPAARVAKVLLDKSPIKTMRDTNEISKDVYNGYKLKLVNIITEYYPGSTKSVRERQRMPKKVPVNTGKHKGRDGVSF